MKKMAPPWLGEASHVSVPPDGPVPMIFRFNTTVEWRILGHQTGGDGDPMV